MRTGNFISEKAHDISVAHTYLCLFTYFLDKDFIGIHVIFTHLLTLSPLCCCPLNIFWHLQTVSLSPDLLLIVAFLWGRTFPFLLANLYHIWLANHRLLFTSINNTDDLEYLERLVKFLEWKTISKRSLQIYLSGPPEIWRVYFIFCSQETWLHLLIIAPANEVAGVYSDPYVRPFVRPSQSNPLLL